MNSKKAMSPLFSTIILIGFAIALGGVVMSWGKAGYSPEIKIAECGKTSLSLISYGENRGICNDEGRLYFTIQNNGEIELEGIKVSLLGSDDIYPSEVNTKINVGDITKLEVEHPDIGKIEKVIFIPRFNDLDDGQLCPKNGFSIEDVGEC